MGEDAMMFSPFLGVFGLLAYTIKVLFR